MGLQQTDFIAGGQGSLLLFHVYHLRPDWTPDQIVDKVRLAAKAWAAENHNPFQSVRVNFDWYEVAMHCREISELSQEVGLIFIEVEIHTKYVWKLETIFDGTE